MLNFHLILPKSFEQFFLNVGPVDVNRFLNRHLDRDLNGYLSVNMDWNFTIYVDWLIHINYFLCDCWYLNGLNDFLLNFEWNFLLNLNVFWNLYNLLNNSLRPWDCPWNLHQYLHRLLDNDLFNYFLRNNMFVSLDFCISVF